MAKLVKPFKIGKMKDVEELTEAMRRLNLDIPVSDDFSVFRRRVPLGAGGKVLPNAMAVNPMEGCDALPDGAPGLATYRRYETYAATGAAVIWFEATSFTEDGASGLHKLAIRPETVDAFKKLIERMDEICLKRHGYRPYKILQLSHGGRSACGTSGAPKPLTVCKNPYLDPFCPGVQVITDEYIEQLEGKVAEAACLAKKAGFDAVDLKPCHDFLLREFLSAYTRPGRFGGSFENRTRFYIDCIDRIHNALGDSLDITVRLNAYDSVPYPYGWGMLQSEGVMREDLDEPIRLVRLLTEKGIRLFSISTMFPRFAPRGKGYLANFDSSAELVPYVGSSLLLEAARRIRRMVPEAVVVAAGLSMYEKYSMNVGAGGLKDGWFDIAGYGRAVLTNPDFIKCALNGRPADETKVCHMCDACFGLLEGGWPTGCVAHDPLYKALRQIQKRTETTA